MSFTEEIPEEEQQPQDSEEEEEEGRWLNLTNDVLSLILKRLNTKADLCRFRSICKTWRIFASPPQPHILFPLSLPPLNPNSRPFSLSPTLIYLISPSKITLSAPENQQQRIWLARVAEIGEKRWDLLNPITPHKLYFSSGVSRKRVNLMGFRNYEVGRSYRLHLVSNSAEEGKSFDFEEFSSSINMRKVVVNIVEGKVTVLGLGTLGKIVVWNMGDKSWDFVEIGENEGQFDDVICYDGRFFAVDSRGRLVMINTTTFEVQEVVAPIQNYRGNNSITYLVEANFKLYMVNKIVHPRPVNYYDEDEEDWVVDKSTAGSPLGFFVFSLNEKEASWEIVRSVGDKVLFVSLDATFSASAEDLGWSKGNCVYFEGLTGYDDEADMRFGLNAGVYTLDDGVISTFDSLPGRWTEIFWPPSSWFSRNDEYPECEMQD